MNEIQILYNEFKNSIFNNPEKGGGLLIKLAKEYSESELMESEAYLFQTELLKVTDDQKLKGIIIADMIDLADKIYNLGENERSSHKKIVDYELIRQQWIDRRQPNHTVFSCKEVSKSFLDSGFTLNDISLELKSGEITGVVGENGNGKTTLLKIIGGVIEINKGQISYEALQNTNPVKIDWNVIKPQIAYLPQELGRLRGNVKESIQFSASMHGVLGNENDKEVRYIIQRLGLSKYENANWENLSGGYKLRFALARILVWKPRLMVLDEPLANLDINTQTRILNDLKQLSQSIKHPICIILSSQNIEEVEAISDNMIVLKNGNIRFNGPINSLGDRRKENIFEFKSDLSRDEIQNKLRNLNYSGLDYNGFYFFISTPLSLSKSKFLRYCAENEIELKYFQDISYSTKKLLIQTTIS